jgi:hypothetical protein
MGTYDLQFNGLAIELDCSDFLSRVSAHCHVFLIPLSAESAGPLHLLSPKCTEETAKCPWLPSSQAEVKQPTKSTPIVEI